MIRTDKEGNEKIFKVIDLALKAAGLNALRVVQELINEIKPIESTESTTSSIKPEDNTLTKEPRLDISK